MGFKRLFHVAPSRAGRDRSQAHALPVEIGAVALEAADLGPPPILQPAAIFRQLLFDPAESSPVWARPRPAPAPVSASSPAPLHNAAVADSAPTVEPKPAKRTRRPNVSAPSGASRTTSKQNTKADRHPHDG
jgi:hypothetical protein